MSTEFKSDVVIGLEIHVELDTRTKLFCSCSRIPIENEKPNSRCCPVCLGHPGSKPTLNKKAVEFALKLALALKCEIAPELIFSRKSYFYPDMAKNYQISQYEIPLGNRGELKLSSDKKVKLTRVHMEEDPASLVHTGDIQKSPFVLVDYNRCGNPLVEIVTEPDMISEDEARDFMKQLITILEYLEIFDARTGIIKADANVSIRDSGYKRAEIKNITGFKEIERALHYEIQRQKIEVKEGRRIVVETRGWDSGKGYTYSMRSKETEEDYGYIIDPDLVVTELTPEWIKSLKEKMPELADEKLRKFKEHGIEKTTANVLSKDKRLAHMYEAVVKEVDHHLASKWIRRDLPKVLNYHKKSLDESGITSSHMTDLLKLVESNKITDKVGQQILDKLVHGTFDVNDYVKKQGLSVLDDTAELEAVCKEAISESRQAVSEFKNGKERALHFIVGKVMQKTKGKAKPDAIRSVLKRLLE